MSQTGWPDNLPRQAKPSLITKSASYVLQDSDLVFDQLYRIFLMDVGTANTFTINTGLVNLAPITIIQIGAGETTIDGTATLRSADGLLTFRLQYSWATILPYGSDIYYISGDLKT